MRCPPDTDAKRLARFYLYRRVKNLWKVTGVPKGSVLVLAGNEAAEVGCLRHYLGVPVEKVFFIDTDPKGLVEAKELWKNVNTFHGKVEDAILSLRGEISFINLDFCGYLKPESVSAVQAAAEKIPVAGVVSYTFTRDRECAVTPAWDLAISMANEELADDPRFKSLKKNSPEWLDMIRFTGYGSILKSMLGNDFSTVFQIRYHSEDGRNMGIIALQHIPRSARTPDWRKAEAKFYSYDEKIRRVHNADLQNKLRDVAMELTNTFSTKEVASILHVPGPKMAAWQANKTRGAYT